MGYFVDFLETRDQFADDLSRTKSTHWTIRQKKTGSGNCGDFV